MVYADGILLSNLLDNGASFTPRWGMVMPEEIERVGDRRLHADLRPVQHGRRKRQRCEKTIRCRFPAPPASATAVATYRPDERSSSSYTLAARYTGITTRIRKEP
jgi:hypothetical protein